MTAREFLKWWFSGLEGQKICLFMIDPKDRKKNRTRFFNKVEEAVELIEEEGSVDEWDVYFGVTTTKKSIRKGRMKKQDCNGMPGLWADFDIKSPLHSKENLPADKAQLLGFLRELPVHPSVLVESGNGFHAYWKFKQPVVISDASMCDRAAAFSDRWRIMIDSFAKRHGWTFDSVHDLPRILRVPGTKNHKSGTPSEVRVIYTEEKEPLEAVEYRAHVQEFESTGVPRPQIGSLVYDSNAEPPSQKFFAVSEDEPRFAQSWARTRSKKEFPNRSPSNWDMSLATIAHQYGWSDQEICDLLIAARRKHGDDLKLRDSYYKTTIAEARTTNGLTIDAKVEIVEEKDKPKDDEDIVERLNGMLFPKDSGIKIVRWLKLETHDGATYAIEVAGQTGHYELGDVNRIMKFPKFEEKVAEVFDIVVRHFTPKAWRMNVAPLILRALEKLDLRASSLVTAVDIVVSEIVEQIPEGEDGWEERHKLKKGFRLDKELYIHSSEVLTRLQSSGHEAQNANKVGSILRRHLGWRSVRKFRPGCNTGASYWTKLEKAYKEYLCRQAQEQQEQQSNGSTER